MICQKCGQNNADGVAYCKHCGSAIYVNPVNGGCNSQQYVQSTPNNNYIPPQDQKAKEKVSVARVISIVAMVMGVVSLLSIITGFIDPALWLLVLLLPIPTLVCSVVSNSICRKYKNDSVYADNIKTIRSFNRLARLGAILTIVLSILLIIGIIVVVLVVGVTAFSDAVNVLGGIFGGFGETVDTIGGILGF